MKTTKSTSNKSNKKTAEIKSLMGSLGMLSQDFPEASPAVVEVQAIPAIVLEAKPVQSVNIESFDNAIDGQKALSNALQVRIDDAQAQLTGYVKANATNANASDVIKGIESRANRVRELSQAQNAIATVRFAQSALDYGFANTLAQSLAIVHDRMSDQKFIAQKAVKKIVGLTIAASQGSALPIGAKPGKTDDANISCLRALLRLGTISNDFALHVMSTKASYTGAVTLSGIMSGRQEIEVSTASTQYGSLFNALTAIGAGKRDSKSGKTFTLDTDAPIVRDLKTAYLSA